METNTIDGEELLEDSYARVKPEADALPADSLLPLSLDIQLGVSTILGTLPELRAQRAEIAKHLPLFDLKRFDSLEDYARALSFAHTKYLTALQPSDDLIALAQQGTELRETLVTDATSLSRRGLLDEQQLKQLKGPVGYRNIAQDLQILASVLKSKWPDVQGKTAITSDELVRAEKLSVRLLRLIGLREQGPVLLAEAADARLRFYTLTLNAYEQARKAIAYLTQSEQEADAIAPSLFAGRRGKRNSQPDVPGPSVVAPASGTPAPAPVVVTPSAGTPAPPASTTPSKDPFLS